MLLTQTCLSIRCFWCCNIEWLQSTERRIAQLHSGVPNEEISVEVDHGVCQDHSLLLHLIPSDGVSLISGHMCRVQEEILNSLCYTL